MGDARCDTSCVYLHAAQRAHSVRQICLELSLARRVFAAPVKIDSDHVSPRRQVKDLAEILLTEVALFAKSTSPNTTSLFTSRFVNER